VGCSAEIIGVNDRQMRRWHWRYREYGTTGCWIGDWASPARGGCR